MSSVQAKGDLLVVPDGARIPKVCLKCGAIKGVVRREQVFTAGALGKGGPYIGGAVGAGTAAAVRAVLRDDPALQALAILAIVAVAVVAALTMSSMARKVALQLPLCEEHDGQFEQARRRRPILLAAVLLGLLVALGGMGLSSVAIAIGGVVLVVAAVIVARSLGMHEAVVHAVAVTDRNVVLRVGADLAKDIAERAAKREAKRAAAREAKRAAAG